jgi:hypothetical protein
MLSVLQVAPESVVARMSAWVAVLSPTTSQVVVDGHATPERLATPDGMDRSVQVLPPLVVLMNLGVVAPPTT